MHAKVYALENFSELLFTPLPEESRKKLDEEFKWLIKVFCLNFYQKRKVNFLLTHTSSGMHDFFADSSQVFLPLSLMQCYLYIFMWVSYELYCTYQD